MNSRGVSESSGSTQAPRSADIDRIGPYEVVATLGRGGMGSVYAVRRASAFGVERLLAAKVLSAQLLGERHFVDMFIDEARIATLLQHPNVVATLDVMDHDGAPIIIMELLRGRSLDHLLRRAPQLPREVLLAILARAARGLHAVHAARGADGQLLRVIHRDVSPQNIHVGYDGQVKLIDFGIAAARGRITTTRTGEVKGKLAYLSPEQLAQGNLDHRTDLFALGVVAWEAFAGRRLFKQRDEAGTMWAILNQPVPRLSELVPDLPAPVVDIVARCLARHATERPESAREVAKVLADAAREVDESAIGAFVAQAFAEERARDEARLLVGSPAARAGERNAPPAEPPLGELEPTAQPGTTGVPTVSAVSVEASTRRGKLRALTAAALASAVALSVVVALLLRPEPAPAPRLAASLAPRVAPRERFQVQIADNVALVLVSGKRRDERPLTLEVEPGGSADVSLVGRDGKLEERRVNASLAGAVLALDEPPAPPPPAVEPRASTSAKRAAVKAVSKSGARPQRAAPGLIGNPY